MEASLRQKDLLLKIVEEYINTARPVSSQLLEQKYDFEVCPATIRNEMQALTGAEYIFQPYTSAGRVPTDKGYRFFVDNLLGKEYLTCLNSAKIEKALEGLERDVFGLIEGITRLLAEASSSFALSYITEKDFMIKNGWAGLFNEPEFKERRLVLDFVGFLENFEKGIKNLDINSSVKTYIGMENPFQKTEEFSIILSKCKLPKKKKGIISIIGPKRMDYNQNIGLVNSIASILEKIKS